MIISTQLEKALNVHFRWNKARMSCFAKMLIGLFTVRTVNLTQIAIAFESKAKYLSRYTRLQRFFNGFEIDYEVIAKFIFSLFDFKKVYLTMDRTNWQWGRANINILMLGIVYKGIAIPIIWQLLRRKANSNTQERIELIKQFISYFGKNCISGLLADREFKGGNWFAWLIKENIPFYIRIANNAVTTNSRGLEIDVDGLFHDVKVNDKKILKGRRKLWGNEVYLSATRSPKDGKLVIIATNANNKIAIDIYYKRWEIETLFQCFKRRGFNFEDTHITDVKRIKKMIVLLSIAFCWAYKTGEWINNKKPIKIKKHGRLSQSIFRYGLNIIQELIFKIGNTNKLFKNYLLFLLPKKRKNNT